MLTNEVFRQHKNWDTDIWYDSKIVDGDGGAVAYVARESPLDAEEIMRRLSSAPPLPFRLAVSALIASAAGAGFVCGWLGRALLSWCA